MPSEHVRLVVPRTAVCIGFGEPARGEEVGAPDAQVEVALVDAGPLDDRDDVADRRPDAARVLAVEVLRAGRTLRSGSGGGPRRSSSRSGCRSGGRRSSRSRRPRGRAGRRRRRAASRAGSGRRAPRRRRRTRPGRDGRRSRGENLTFGTDEAPTRHTCSLGSPHARQSSSEGRRRRGATPRSSTSSSSRSARATGGSRPSCSCSRRQGRAARALRVHDRRHGPPRARSRCARATWSACAPRSPASRARRGARARRWCLDERRLPFARRVDERREHERAVGRAEQRIDRVLGMRHQPHHVALSVARRRRRRRPSRSGCRS